MSKMADFKKHRRQQAKECLELVDNHISAPGAAAGSSFESICSKFAHRAHNCFMHANYRNCVINACNYLAFKVGRQHADYLRVYTILQEVVS